MQAAPKADFISKAPHSNFMVGACPCDTCYHATHCKRSAKACQAFRGFVRRGRWLDRHIGVDLK